MMGNVAEHYGGEGRLADVIAGHLAGSGRTLEGLTTADLAGIDEFHIRGRAATLELAERMSLEQNSRVLDLGSGLGGPARTLAETYRCRVTGIDLTPAFCEAADALSRWVGLGDRVTFQAGDATDLPFADDHFDAAMTLHVAMNIAAKDRMYAEARRVLKAGGVFAVYDILQGEGGDVLFPVPWARDPAISHLATPDEMIALLTDAGFVIRQVWDSTEESRRWFEQKAVEVIRDGSSAMRPRSSSATTFHRWPAIRCAISPSTASGRSAMSARPDTVAVQTGGIADRSATWQNPPASSRGYLPC